MNNRNKIPKSCYSIIILLIILLALFLVSKLIFNNKPLNITNNKPLNIINDKDNQRKALELRRGKKIGSDFFVRIVQHTFPNRKIQGQYSKKQHKTVLSFKEVGTSFFTGIFKIDFNNPLTFIQAQLPAVAAHHDILAISTSNNKDDQIEKNWFREIYFVDYDKKEEPVIADNGVASECNINENKLEDLEKNKHTINDSDIVDSLDSVSMTDLAGVPKPKPIEIKKNKPSILIYHTHGTESYKPENEGNYHSLKKEYTVIGAANIITKELEKKGYNVIHDITYHDYPSYSGSYNRSASTVKSILKKNPSIKVILDVHRDGYEKIDTRSDRSKLIKNSKIEINGKHVARFQFVIGATSKNRKQVECFARFVKAVSDHKYPGFSKDILIKQYGSYNQYLSDYAALIELGTNANTIEEAERAGYYFADVISDALKLLSE